MAFKIDEEFRSYLPAQTAEETAALTKKILAEGARPGSLTVAVLPEGRFLIDGHNTLAICKANKIDAPDEIQVVLADREAVFAWMRENQLARRNLTAEQRAYFIGKEYEARKKTSGEIGGRICHPDTGKTAETIASEQKVSPRTVRSNAQFAAGVDKIAEANPQAKAQILSGQSPMTKAEVIAAGKPALVCRACRMRAGGPKPGCKDCVALQNPKASKPLVSGPTNGATPSPEKENPRSPPEANGTTVCPVCGQETSDTACQSAVPIPPELDTPEFIAAWDEWAAFRRRKKAKLTTVSTRLQLEDLAPLGPTKAIECLRSSMKNGYTGIFPDKFGKPANGKPGIYDGLKEFMEASNDKT